MHVSPIGHCNDVSPRARRWGSLAVRVGGFTLIELLIVLGIIVVLLSLVLATFSHARKQAQGVECLYHLHQIHDAFNFYCMENNNYFPVPQLQGQSWESMIQKYVGGHTDVFRCPADSEIWQQVGSSYDWRSSSSDPSVSLGGKKRTDKLRGDAVLAYETLPDWHEVHMMNVVRIDGAAGPMDEDAFGQDVLNPVILNR